MCWTIEVAGVELIAAAHIHEAPSTAPGPIVGHLNADFGCTVIDRDLALAIIRDPGSYYVNVHNAAILPERCAGSSPSPADPRPGR